MKRRTTEITVMDLGASHVACAVFTNGRSGGLAIQRLRVEELANGAGPLNDWVGEVGRAIERMSDNGKSGSGVHLSLPTHVALTRFNRVPALSTAKLGRVLEFEAAQTIPFPLNEVN